MWLFKNIMLPLLVLFGILIVLVCIIAVWDTMVSSISFLRMKHSIKKTIKKSVRDGNKMIEETILSFYEDCDTAMAETLNKINLNEENDK